MLTPRADRENREKKQPSRSKRKPTAQSPPYGQRRDATYPTYRAAAQPGYRSSRGGDYLPWPLSGSSGPKGVFKLRRRSAGSCRCRSRTGWREGGCPDGCVRTDRRTPRGGCPTLSCLLGQFLTDGFRKPVLPTQGPAARCGEGLSKHAAGRGGGVGSVVAPESRVSSAAAAVNQPSAALTGWEGGCGEHRGGTSSTDNSSA